MTTDDALAVPSPAAGAALTGTFATTEHKRRATVEVWSDGTVRSPEAADHAIYAALAGAKEVLLPQFCLVATEHFRTVDRTEVGEVEATWRVWRTKRHRTELAPVFVAAHPDAANRARIARRTTSTTLLECLADDPAEGVRVAVAENQVTPVALLGRLARDPEPRVVYGIARNPATPPEVLEDIDWQAVTSHNEVMSITYHLASRPDCPPGLLRDLAGHPDAVWLVARNPATPLDVLAELVAGTDDFARSIAANNPSTPLESLRPRYGHLTVDAIIEVTESGAGGRLLDLFAENPDLRVQEAVQRARNGEFGWTVELARGDDSPT